MAPSKRNLRLAFALLLLVGAAIGAAAAAGAFGPSGPTPAERAAARAAAARAAFLRALRRQERIVAGASSLVAVALPTTPGASSPDVPTSLFAAPLARHAVYGFVPYWSLGSLTPSDYEDTSVLAYFGVTVGATGGLDHTGNGWSDLPTASFASFVATAHGAGDRVLLTVSTTDPKVIAALTRDPSARAARLAAEVASVVTTYHLDGVDLDIEGRSTSERAPFTRFVDAFAAGLRARDPLAQLVVDTYPQSAGSAKDFFDVHALARVADQLFVMAYDMDDPSHASANAPLASPTLGLSDVGSLLAYAKSVPPSKLVLGIPLYGYDFTTVSPSAGARVVSGPVAVTYGSIVAAAHAARWDPGSLTPYAVFRAGGRWHETWYDNPVSIALKVALAASFRLGGVGVWALGQEGTSSDVVAALDGGAGPLKLPVAGG